jgi:hypothetical protein
MTMFPQLRESPETANVHSAAAGIFAAAVCRAQPLVDDRQRKIAPASRWIGLENFTLPPMLENPRPEHSRIAPVSPSFGDLPISGG